MTTEEKKKTILEAVEAKRVSARKIDKSGKGTNVTRMGQDKSVKPETIDKIYNAMMFLLNQNVEEKEVSEKEKAEAKDGKKMDANAMIAIAKRLETLEKQKIELSRKLEIMEIENQSLSSKLEELTNITKIITNNIQSITKDVTSIVTNITNPVTNTITNEITKITNVVTNDVTVNGIAFTIKLESQSVSGKEYKRFYAKKTIAGKLHRIYLGEIFREDQAQEKIKAYCNKHSLTVV